MLTELQGTDRSGLYRCVTEGTAEQQRSTLVALFTHALDDSKLKKLALRECDVDIEQVSKPKSGTVLVVADKVLGQLARVQGEDEVIGAVAKGAQKLWVTMANSRRIIDALRNPTEESAATVSRLLTEGAELSPQVCWRYVLNAEGKVKSSLAKVLVRHDIYPDPVNLGFMVTNWDEANRQLFIELLKKNIYVTNEVLWKVLKYLHGPDVEWILVRICTTVNPTEEQLEFARRHRVRAEYTILQNWVPTEKVDSRPCIADERFFEGAKKLGKKKKDAVPILLNSQTPQDLSALVCKIVDGGKLNSQHITHALKRLGPNTTSFVRLLLLAGAELEPNHLIDLLNSEILDKVKKKDDVRLKVTCELIVILRIFGAKLSETHHERVAVAWNEVVREEILHALTVDVTGRKQHLVDAFPETTFKAVANEYLERLPGVMEMVLRAGHIPTLGLLALFFEKPKITFFEMLMKDPVLGDKHGFQTEQAQLAAQTSTADIVKAYHEWGVPLSPELMRLAFDHFTAEGFDDLAELYHPQENSADEGVLVTEMNVGDPLFWSVDEPDAESLQYMEKLIGLGYPLGQALLERAKKAQGPFAVLQLKLLEKHGL